MRKRNIKDKQKDLGVQCLEEREGEDGWKQAWAAPIKGAGNTQRPPIQTIQRQPYYHMRGHSIKFLAYIQGQIYGIYSPLAII